MGQIINSHPTIKYCYQPFFSYAFRDRITTNSNLLEIRKVFDEMFESSDPFITQTGPEKISKQSPVFDKKLSNLLAYKEVRFHDLLPNFIELIPEFKAIGIVRDPRFVLASWRNAPREFASSWSFTEEWRHAEKKNRGLDENWYGFTRWMELSRMFIQLENRHPDSFKLIRYEDLTNDTYSSVNDIFAFLGLSVGSQTLDFISESSSMDDGDPYGVYRIGKSNAMHASRANIDASIEESIISECMETPLARFLTSSDFD